MKSLTILSCIAILVCLSHGKAQAATRVALVIGNSAYVHGVPLANPKNDAGAVAAALKLAGFDVTLVTDAGHAMMEEKVIEFRRKAEGAEAAWFFYAGHGVEVKGSNYLVPVDAEVKEEFQVKHKTLALDQVLGALNEAGTPLKVVVLDCCRDNPFGRGWSRSTVGGLGQVGSTPQGTIIAYAAAPGKTAADGRGTNSPYTTALLKALTKSGLDIDQVFKETGRLVLEATNRSQQPWINSSFYDQFVLVAPGTAGTGTSRSVLFDGEIGKVIQVELPGGSLMKFCYCPPGDFMMGSKENENDRQHDESQVSVRITCGYWLAQTECTQGQWAAVMGSKPSKFKGNDELPVEQVSWDDAQAFVRKLSSLVTLPSGWEVSLPSEAQWEYACRAGTESKFNFGDVLDGKEANCVGKYPYGTNVAGPSLDQTTVVKSYRANGWGFYDMHGNVSEWCADWYGKKLGGGSDARGPFTGVHRVYRGGSWSDFAAFCRIAVRFRREAGFRDDYLGFRVAFVTPKQ